MSSTFYHCGQPYKSSPAAQFEHNGHRYEARMLRLCRGMWAAYVYNHTSDLEGVFSHADMYVNSGVVEMPNGQRFYVSARLGDWLEHPPLVKALDLTLTLA